MAAKKKTSRSRAASRKKSPSSEAGEYVREEIHKIRRGEHGARSPEQAIAIGLSKARRRGVRVPAPRPSTAKASTRRAAKYATEVGRGIRKPTRRPRVSKAVSRVLKRESTRSASHAALSRHAKKAAARRSPAARSRSARQAAQTKGAAGRSAAARKAARTRAKART